MATSGGVSLSDRHRKAGKERGREAKRDRGPRRVKKSTCKQVIKRHETSLQLRNCLKELLWIPSLNKSFPLTCVPLMRFFMEAYFSLWKTVSFDDIGNAT